MHLLRQHQEFDVSMDDPSDDTAGQTWMPVVEDDANQSKLREAALQVSVSIDCQIGRQQVGRYSKPADKPP